LIKTGHLFNVEMTIIKRLSNSFQKN